MSLHESAEMYLETIYSLSKVNSTVRSIDVAEALGYSRPSVSRAIGLLKQGGYITVAHDGCITLTDAGLQAAAHIFERHTVLTQALAALGVCPKVAAEDACRIEHVISDETMEALRAHVARMQQGAK